MNPSTHHIRVPRTARYSTLGDPGSAEEVWFVLHGYRQLAARFIRRFVDLPGVGARRAVVAPEALSRFYVEREVGEHGRESRVGASWMTRADREHEIRDYVEYLDRVAAEVLASDAVSRLVVLGFSQGSETASRWVVLGRTRPAELVLWGGGSAVDLEGGAMEEALREVELRLVVGDADAWGQRRSEETLARLESLGLSAERLEYAGGHAILEDVLRRHWP